MKRSSRHTLYNTIHFHLSHYVSFLFPSTFFFYTSFSIHIPFPEQHSLAPA
jgi:hypothetical protein